MKKCRFISLQVNIRLHYFLHSACLLCEENSSCTSIMQSYNFLEKKVLLTYEDRKGKKAKGKGK